MQKKIQQLEEENLQPKLWKFSGEAVATKRPLNSLLGEDLEYEHATKIAPVITDEVTKTLEDIIKYRIIENAFDDIIRKIVVESKGDRRQKGIELDSNKSKKSLSQVYEQEYQEQTQKVERVDNANPAHDALSSLFRRICEQLDALSNTNFTPRVTKKEKEKSKNREMPAIQMEEVIPVTLSTVSQLAPEEIFTKQDKLLQGETEKTREDRQKERKELKKKWKKEKTTKEHEQRRKEKLAGNPQKKEEDIKKGSVEKAVRQIKESGDRSVKFVSGTDTTNYSQSTALFRKLQENAKMEAKQIITQNTNKKEQKKDTSANVFKL